MKRAIFSLGETDDNFGSVSSPSDRLTPPSSPRLIKEKSDLGSTYDPVDLQLDYWAVVQPSAEAGNISNTGKCDLSWNFISNFYSKVVRIWVF